MPLPGRHEDDRGQNRLDEPAPRAGREADRSLGFNGTLQVVSPSPWVNGQPGFPCRLRSRDQRGRGTDPIGSARALYSEPPRRSVPQRTGRAHGFPPVAPAGASRP
ncbi:hypothetical protein OF001_U30089 [Pseudomonas sp. OF001]|nr:hypothetical protein OF001_U30089 [Pseudomonas sp. OF001]